MTESSEEVLEEIGEYIEPWLLEKLRITLYREFFRGYDKGREDQREVDGDNEREAVERNYSNGSGDWG